jgi:hypothetical protein
MKAEPSTIRADEITTLGRVRFPDLSEPEGKLLRAAVQGTVAWLGPSSRDDDSTNDPSNAVHWGLERNVRAEVLRWLCVDRSSQDRVDPTGVRLHGAKIVGNLDLSFARLPFPLALVRCRMNDDLVLTSAEIPALILDGNWVRTVHADGVNVKGPVLLRNGFTAEDTVNLSYARIGGNLECDGGTFTGQAGAALNANAVVVNGYVFLRQCCSTRGEVNLIHAQIGGNLECDGSTFKNPTGTALNADTIDVKGNVFLRGHFSAEGRVNFLHARIGGNLECDGGTFHNPIGTALNADSADVKGNVFLRQPFTAEGEVSLLHAQIGGDVLCSGGTFTKLAAYRAAIRGNFLWSKVQNAKNTVLDLRDSSVGSISDDAPSWPAYGNLKLDGFVYGRISGGPTGAEERLKWLRLQNPFTPQPYRQLSKALQDRGDDEGGRRVLFEMEDRLRATDASLTAQIERWPLRWMVGYGYYPLRSVLALGIVCSLGWVLYRRAHIAGAMVPTDEKACAYLKAHGHLPAGYTRLYPLVYSFENSLPLVKLGQADRWQPDPNGQNRQPPCGGRLRAVCRLVTSRRFLLCFLWFQILLGWILATLFAAGVTGILHSD